jgi:hypothetical protein
VVNDVLLLLLRREDFSSDVHADQRRFVSVPVATGAVGPSGQRHWSHLETDSEHGDPKIQTSPLGIVGPLIQ